MALNPDTGVYEPRPYNQRFGRTLNRKGVAMSTMLMDTVEERLRTEPLHRIPVKDVARRVGTSPANFYQYFASLDDVVGALLDRLSAYAKAEQQVQFSELTAANLYSVSGAFLVDPDTDLADALGERVVETLEFLEKNGELLAAASAVAATGDQSVALALELLLGTLGSALVVPLGRADCPPTVRVAMWQLAAVAQRVRALSEEDYADMAELAIDAVLAVAMALPEAATA